MVRADSINDTALSMSASFFGGAHCGFQVAGIVECVENADDGNAVIYRAFNKFRNNIIG